MKIQTTRFGELDIDKSRIITFTEGIFGFQQCRTYVLLDHEKNSPFKWLQSTEKPDLAFVLIDPMIVIPDYQATVSSDEIKDLELTSPDKAVVVCIVTIAKGCTSVTANMVGPIIMNFDKMLAKQVILNNSNYSLRHNIITSMKNKEPEKETKVNSSG